mgnify:FL=1
MWLLAGVLAVLGSAFLVWVIVHHLLGPTVQAQEVSFVVAPDEASVEVVFDISMPPGHQADCTLEALDRNFGQAGLVDVRVGPFDATTVRLSETIATSAAPVTAQIRSCELVP